MDIRVKFISELIKHDKIVLQYIETNNMLADLLTKCVVLSNKENFHPIWELSRNILCEILISQI